MKIEIGIGKFLKRTLPGFLIQVAIISLTLMGGSGAFMYAGITLGAAPIIILIALGWWLGGKVRRWLLPEMAIAEPTIEGA